MFRDVCIIHRCPSPKNVTSEQNNVINNYILAFVDSKLILNVSEGSFNQSVGVTGGHTGCVSSRFSFRRPC